MVSKPTYEELEKVIQGLKLSLKESADQIERFQSLFKNTPIPYQSLDEKGCLLEVNQAWLDTLEYTQQEVIGKSFCNFLSPDTQNHFKHNFPRFKAAGEISGIEFKMAKKDGSYLTVLFTGKIGKDKKGNFKQTHCIFQDITKNRLDQEALRTSESKLHSILNSMEDLVFILDKDNRFVFVFAPEHKLYLMADSFIGKRHCDTMPKHIDELFSAALLKLKKEETAKYEYQLEMSDGLYWYHMTLSPLREGNEYTGVVGVARNITVQKQAEIELQEKELKLRLLADYAYDWEYWLGVDGNYIYISPSCERITGYKPEEFISNPELLFKIVRPDYAEKAHNHYYDENNKDTPIFSIEFPIISKDGKEVWLEHNCSPVFDGQGNYAGRRGNNRDITSRVTAENKLKSVYQLYETIVESSPVGIGIYNSKGDCVATNEQAAVVTGGTKIQVLQQNYHHLDSWKNSGLYEIALTSIKEKITKRHEISIVSSFGKYLVLDIHIVPTTIADEPHLLILFDDITQRKLSDEKIMQLGHIFDWSLNEIYQFDSETLKFIMVNRSAQSNLGYTMEEFQNLTPLDLKPEFTIESFKKITESLIKKEKKKVVFETVHKRKDQSVYPVEVHLQLQEYDHKKLFTAIIIDITERKQEEKEKIKIEAQYRQAQKMESVGRLAGGVAHDFNNALSVIQGFTELVLDDTDPKGQMHEDLNEIHMAANRAADITRQLLAFARKQTISPLVLDLNENVESMLKMLRRLIGEDIDLAWLPGVNLWSVEMDPTQIDQILANLCVNARDAIEGVGKLTIESENITLTNDYCINHTGFVPGEFVKLSVSDNGCGMNKEVLDNIFEPFFTTKEVGKGTGLGLATVYGIVKQNNGFINVYSEPDIGTTIKIYLPMHETENVEDHKESIEELPISEGETVLVVEDDPAILNIMKKILEKLGYTVLISSAPEKTKGIVKEYTSKIHLLITDVIMPKMNGRDLAEQLQSDYPDLKCIFMSGYTADAIVNKEILDEKVNFIQKPFSRMDLAEIVRKVLDEN